jgi:hypothetical protein
MGEMKWFCPFYEYQEKMDADFCMGSWCNSSTNLSKRFGKRANRLLTRHFNFQTSKNNNIHYSGGQITLDGEY